MTRTAIHRLALSLLAALTATALACGPSAQDMQEIRDRQEQILEKLTKIEEGLGAQARPRRPQRPAEDFDRVYEIPVGDSPVLGNPNAPVTIVEFSDFQCPFCARTSPLLKEVLEKHGENVRIVYKHFPLNFHRAARPAAVASLAAHEQGRFWEMHDVLFENSRTLDVAKMEEYAKAAGLDVERFKKDLEAKGQQYEQRVQAEFQQGVAADVRGTPAVYVNGRKLKNRSLDGFSAQIDAALEGAGGE
jgi:protein-disulfide isomerase